MGGLIVPGIKHLIECHCVLAIYRKNEKIINHKFPVYSKIDEKGNIIEKLVKCNNCEAVHLVKEYCRSEIRAGKDQTEVTVSKEDMKYMLSERVNNFLERENVDLATWEQVLDLIEDKRWGEPVVVKRDIIGEDQHVKIITFISEDRFKVSSEVIRDIVR